jgi:hypothetical protein
MKNTYTVIQNFGRGHNHYVGDIEADSTKEAFKAAVIKYFKPNWIDKYSEFFVTQTKVDTSDFTSYGYSYEGQRSFSCGPSGFRTNLKNIIDKILIEENLI